MAPVSPKVTVASVTAFVVSMVTTYILKGADPTVVESVVTPLVTAGATFLGGWLAKHTKDIETE